MKGCQCGEAVHQSFKHDQFIEISSIMLFLTKGRKAERLFKSPPKKNKKGELFFFPKKEGKRAFRPFVLSSLLIIYLSKEDTL